MAEKQSCGTHQSADSCGNAGCRWDDGKKKCRDGGVMPFIILMGIAVALLVFKSKKCQPALLVKFGLPKSGSVEIWGPEGFHYKNDNFFNSVLIPLQKTGKYTYLAKSNGYKDKSGSMGVGCDTLSVALQLLPL